MADFVGRFSVLLAGRLLGALALFVINILIINHLGTEALADFAVFSSLVSVLAICLFFGFNTVASIYAAEYQATDKLDLLKGFGIGAIRNGGLATLAIALAFFAFWIYSPAIIGADTLIYFCIIVATAWGAAALGLNGAIQIGIKRPVKGQIPDTFVRPLFMLIGMGVLLATQMSDDVSVVYVIACISVWLALLLAIIANADFFVQLQAVKRRAEGRRWFRASLPWMGTSLVWDHLIDIMVLVASLLAGSAELAVLHVAFRYRVLAGFGMRTIYTLYMPQISENSTNKNIPELRRKIRHVNLISFAYSICVLLGFMVLGNWLFALFSLDVAQGLPVLIVVSITMVIRAVFGPAPLILAVNNVHLATLFASILGFIVATFWLLLFYPSNGIIAAAIGYTASNLLVSVFLWLYAWRRTGINSAIFQFEKPSS